MEEITQLLKEFERRNNISATFVLCSDGSMGIEEFWDNEMFVESEDVEEIKDFLRKTQFKFGKDGLCLSPIQIVTTP
ncbi:MAG: hypothetical protein AAGF96_06010 [Bacteroidota bacterium]